jgi:hypothetical protein
MDIFPTAKFILFVNFECLRVLNVIDGIEQLASKSYSNEKEAELVPGSQNYPANFNDTSMHGKTTGVSTFYEGQIHYFRKILSEMGIAWSKFYFSIVIIL